VGSPPDTGGDEATYRVIDLVINRRVGVNPILEEKAFFPGRFVRLLGHQAAQRHLGVGLQPPEAGEPGKGAHGLRGDLPAAVRRPRRGVDQPQTHADAQFGQHTDRVTDMRRQPDSAIGPDTGVGLHRMHAVGPGPSTVLPQHPFSNGGPRLRGGCRSNDEPEVTCPQQHLGHLGTGGGPPDSSHGRGLADVIDLADEREDRTGDFRERDQRVIDHDAAGHHAVMDYELP